MRLGRAAVRAAQAAVCARVVAAPLNVVGVEVQVGPTAQSVPKGVTSTVTTQLVTPAATIPLESILGLLPQGLTVRGELSGPAFATPLTLSAPAGQPLTLPTLPLLGTYTLKNLRLVSGTEDLLAASPSVVTIEAIGEVLVTQVVTRPLTLDEIQARGIVVDSSNFTVVTFTAVVGTSSTQVPIEFPVAIPRVPTSSTGGGGGGEFQLPSVSLPSPQAPNLVARPITFVPVLDLDADEAASLPPIPALLVFPGTIGFLHQFFQALLIVTNGAPAASPLVVTDLAATITLPPGADRVPGTDEAPGDDPLRVAKLEGLDVVHTLPVTAAGPDGRFGTADDQPALAPQVTGQADVSVEGLQEGVHEVAFELTGTLLGLPRGPVPILGRARGAILVRNPNVALTLSHPSVVRRGEPYDSRPTRWCWRPSATRCRPSSWTPRWGSWARPPAWRRRPKGRSPPRSPASPARRSPGWGRACRKRACGYSSASRWGGALLISHSTCSAATSPTPPLIASAGARRRGRGSPRRWGRSSGATRRPAGSSAPRRRWRARSRRGRRTSGSWPAGAARA